MADHPCGHQAAWSLLDSVPGWAGAWMMIVVQTPLRVSFFGGGTDFSSFFKEEGGSILSSAINKYIFVAIKKRFDDKLRIGYTKTEIADCVDEIQHELIREALRKTGITKGVEITTMGDIPAGSGLGSSSAVTVGSLQAMYSYRNEIVPAEQLAREACDIEIGILGKPIGIQDQYIAAYGGLRFIEINSDGQVSMDRVKLDPVIERQLNENLLLFYTGVTRKAETILEEQQTNTRNNMDVLRELKRMAYIAREELMDGHIDSFGRLLNEGWALKKQLASKISNGDIDLWYQNARKAGALGGKITGAGGGGFLLLYCPVEKREQVRNALVNLRELPFKLEPDGTKVILNYQTN